jgi:hypothetical protein
LTAANQPIEWIEMFATVFSAPQSQQQQQEILRAR